jgi:hypothetical protein
VSAIIVAGLNWYVRWIMYWWSNLMPV